MKNILRSAALVLLMTGASCKRDLSTEADSSDVGPSVTATINGHPWKSFMPLPYPDIEAQHDSLTYFGLSAFNSLVSNGISSITMQVQGLNGTGTFNLDHINTAVYYDAETDRYYHTDSVFTGILQVTDFNYSKGKISGEFEFLARDSVSGDSVTVEEGRIVNVVFTAY